MAAAPLLGELSGSTGLRGKFTRGEALEARKMRVSKFPSIEGYCAATGCSEEASPQVRSEK